MNHPKMHRNKEKYHFLIGILSMRFHGKNKNVAENLRNFHTAEKWKYYSKRKNISSSQLCMYLVILVIKLLFTRNFCKKCVRVNFRNFHTAAVFDKNFVKSTVLLKSWFHEIFFSEREFLVFPLCNVLLWQCAQCGNYTNLVSRFLPEILNFSLMCKSFSM